MAICNSCGKESRQIRTIFEVGGVPLPEPKDECQNCKDGGLHLDPAWQRHRPTPLWESRPHLYRKKDNPEGGSYYEPTDENLADLEAQILAPAADDAAVIETAIEAKRQTRRTEPLIGDELKLALERANRIAENCVQAHNQTVSEHAANQEEYWDGVSEGLRTIQ